MPRSMTGFGVGQETVNGHRITVEVRSVNNRYLEIALKLPRALYAFDSALRDAVRARVERGRVSVYANEEWDETAAPQFKIDIAKARRYALAMDQLRRELNLTGSVTLDHLLSLPELIAPLEDEAYNEQLWNLTQAALNKALDAFMDVSDREGRNLAADLTERLNNIEADLTEIRNSAAQQVSQYRERLLARLGELMDDARLDPARLETEVSLAADRLDISEEIVRLTSHVGLFRQTLKNDKSIGKTLGFVLQEMGREANTIGSKSWMVEISQAAMRIKETLEQMREQVQNLE